MWNYLLLFLWLPNIAIAQRVSGYYTDIVRDENGFPVAGASVIIKGSRTGTVTDKNGYFKLQVTEGNVIRISSVGLAGSEIKITAAMLQSYTGLHQKAVEPVLSADYAALIRQRPGIDKPGIPDSIETNPNKTLPFTGRFYSYLPVKEVILRNNTLQIYQNIRKQLNIQGNYNATVEIKNINRIPALQTLYAQGRPTNGALTWRGAETGELFSFGPSIQALEFDGSAYGYDKNGRLVIQGSGNGSHANVYHNTIFRTGLLRSQSLTVNSSLMINNERILRFKIGLGQTDQSTVIRENENSKQYFNALVGVTKKQVSITGTYHYVQDKFSKGNRNGFLNRVYQNTVLTPASFDNTQGYHLANGQRSYSNGADNPYFLLNGNNNNYRQSQHLAGLTLEQKQKNLSFKVVQSFEVVKQVGNETYKPGTAYFENGISTQRVQVDKKYYLQANAVYKIPFSTYHLSSEVWANYHFNAANTDIRYRSPITDYHYQRSSHEAYINSKGSYTNRNFEAGYNAANKMYVSNTSRQQNFFLPSAGVYVRLARVLNVFSVKTSSSFHSFNSELPISQSLAYTNLLQYSTQQSFQYFPVQEVSGYQNLTPIHHQEWTGRIELSYQYKLSVSAEIFTRNTSNDIFPVFQNGNLHLTSVASHQNKGLELQASFNDNWYRKKITMHHSLSFFTYRSRVTSVADGFDHLPIAGFSNVHKAIVKGQPVGVIMGNSYLKNENKNWVIGADGFPLVNHQPQVIGNPIPDFVMKLSNNVQWKNLALHVDWEWKKGGDNWNGTQATLDYYGRSLNSALLRNTTNYIFPGVMQNGQKNGIAVNFLNENEPVENNRWTRYGYSGVAEAYIEKADYLKINSITLAYPFHFKRMIQAITLSAYINNILLWSAYSGTDSNQLLYDQPNGDGLDFFNLPSVKTIGFNASIQF